MKTSFSRIAIAAAVLLTAGAASAEYLYAWLGDQEGVVRDMYSYTPIEFSYATFSVPSSTKPLAVNDKGDTVNAPSTTAFYVGDTETTFNTFLVELWLNDGSSETRVGWQTFNRSQFADSIFDNEKKATGSGTPFSIAAVIPEPSSALLMLFGLAGLALRRRKGLMSMLMVGAISGAVFAAQNDPLVTFSTPGPDTYADGTTVLPGECYALVWSKTPDAFAVAANGETSGGEIVLVAPVAKDGHCPEIIFQVPTTKYKGGNWSVYLLDTRRYGKNGAVSPAGVGADGKVKLVNAIGAVAGSKISVADGALSTVLATAGAKSSAASAVPEDAPAPEIKAIRIVGGNVFVTVENAVPYLTYDLSEGDTPDQVTERVNDPRTGGDDGTVILVAPKKEGGAFFKVNRN